MNTLFVFRVDDWSALYVNGEVQCQGHEIEIRDIQDYCPIKKIEVVWAERNLDEYVTEVGFFPKTLEECQKITEGKE